MSNKTKVIVRIFGQEYTMVGAESREYMQKVANFVDDKMVEIARNSKKLSTSMVAVLTALNVGDAYFKIRKQLDELEKAAMAPLTELEQTRSQLAAAKSELETREVEFAEAMNRMAEEQKGIQMQESLLKEIEQLKLELMAKDKELHKMTTMNEDLQNKLFNCQIKYVQARKELEAFIETFDGEKK